MQNRIRTGVFGKFYGISDVSRNSRPQPGTYFSISSDGQGWDYGEYWIVCYHRKTDNIDLQINYDTNADVLYLSFGTPRKAISKEAGDGKFIRFDSIPGEIIGITILDFRERYFKEKS